MSDAIVQIGVSFSIAIAILGAVLMIDIRLSSWSRQRKAAKPEQEGDVKSIDLLPIDSEVRFGEHEGEITHVVINSDGITYDAVCFPASLLLQRTYSVEPEQITEVISRPAQRVTLTIETVKR